MKVYKNLLWNFGLQIVIFGIPLVTLPYISRVLGPNGVGVNAYTNSVVQYFVLIAGMGINIYGSKRVAMTKNNRLQLSDEFWSLTGVKFICSFVAFVFFALYVLIKADRYTLYFLEQSLLIISVMFDITWFFQGLEHFKTTVVRNVLMRLLSAICIFIFVKHENDIGIYITINALSNVLSNLILWLGIRKYIFLKPKLKKRKLFNDFKQSIALFVPQVATQIYLPLNKMLLGVFIGVSASGFFDNSDKIIKVVVSVITSMGVVFLPHATSIKSKNKNSDNEVLNMLQKTMNVIFLLGIFLTISVVSLARSFSLWFFGVKFMGVGQLMQLESPVILFIAISNAIGYQYFIPTNQTKKYTKSVTIGSIFNIIIDIPAIYFFGIYGAVIATSFSELVVVVIQILSLKKVISIKVLFSEVWKYFLSALSFYSAVLLFQLNITGEGFFYLCISEFVGALAFIIILLLLKPNGLLKSIKYILKM